VLKKKSLRFIARLTPLYKIRIWVLRICGYKIGRDVFIGEGVIIIDDFDDGSTGLMIEDRAAISPRVTLVLNSYPNWSNLKSVVPMKKGTTVIQKDAWIGAGAVIMPNVRIGQGAIVGANSVVTHDVPDYTVVGGVPARRIKDLPAPAN